MPSLACIGMESSCVPMAGAVPPSAFCVDKPLQYLGPAPATTTPALSALPDSAAVVVRPLISPASEAEAVPCPTFPHAGSISASLGPASAPNALALASAHLYSYPLLAVAMVSASTIQRAPCLNSFFVGKKPQLCPHHQLPQITRRLRCSKHTQS